MDILSPDRLHVIASESGAGHLIHYANLRGQSIRNNLLVFRYNHLSIGPISTILDLKAHFEWIDENAPSFRRYLFLDEGGLENDYRALNSEFDKIKFWHGPVTLWYSSREIDEMSFFLAFTQKFDKSLNVDFIDVAATPFDGKVLLATGECTAATVSHTSKFAYQMSDEKLEHAHEKFRSLDANTQGVRVFRQGIISEAPNDVHDSAIMECFDNEWKSLNGIAEKLFKGQRQGQFRDITYASLLWRLKILQQQDRIKRRGESKNPLFEDSPLLGEGRLN